MSNLIMSTRDTEDGYTEIVLKAIDDCRDGLSIFQKGNTYTDYGYMEFSLFPDLFENRDKSNNTQMVQALKAIAQNWDCDFNDDHEFTTTNDDRDQALLDLVQCISAVIGFCRALSDIRYDLIDIDKLSKN